MKRLLISALMAVAAANTGCGTLDAVIGGGHCGPCGQVPCHQGPVGRHGGAYGCEPCVGPCHNCIGCPLADLFVLMNPCRIFGASCRNDICGDDCGACPTSCCWDRLFGWGCGPKFYGDFWADPMAHCESCDGDGNWIGSASRHSAGCACGGGGHAAHGMAGHSAPVESVEPAPRRAAPGRPTPAAPDVKPMPTDEPPMPTEEKTTRFVPRKKTAAAKRTTPSYQVRETSATTWRSR